MPPRLPLEPVLHATRQRHHRAGGQPLVAAGGRSPGSSKFFFTTPKAANARRVAVSRRHSPRAEIQPQRQIAAGRRRKRSRKRSRRVWDVNTGKRVTEVGDEYDTVLAADISADQSRIALGGPSKIVRIYSTADGE